MIFIRRVFFLLCLSCFAAFSQAQEILQKGNVLVGGDFGISFYNRDIARLNSQDIPGGVSMTDALRVHLHPKIYYGVAQQLFVQGYLGLDYSHYKRQTDGLRLVSTNWSIGSGLKYYFLEIAEPVFLSAEVGVAYNIFQINHVFSPQENRHQGLISSYLDIALEMDLGQGWMFAVILKDLVEYQSDVPNFKHREGWKTNNVFRHFIRYPHFGVYYRLP